MDPSDIMIMSKLLMLCPDNFFVGLMSGQMPWGCHRGDYCDPDLGYSNVIGDPDNGQPDHSQKHVLEFLSM